MDYRIDFGDAEAARELDRLLASLEFQSRHAAAKSLKEKSRLVELGEVE